MQHPTNKWMIQVPRLFGLYRRSGKLRNFQEMLSNIFAPLWEASIHPERHPFLHIFLANISAMDSVDNESDREGDQSVFVSPELWTAPHNPPFFYYMYYMWANLVTLNRYRSRRGLSTLKFRPHAGESGDPDHMAEVFLLADGIGHGINLMYRPVLQYLYYLAQIPLALVPLSNNSLFCKYEHNPLPLFFRRGLQVAIATDGALMFHRTEQPLVEEYSTAQNFWSLSNTDISELALNSILMSGFSDQQKRQWLGPLYSLRSIVGNDVRRSKVAHTRVTFRYEVYIEEIAYLQNRSAAEILNPAMLNPLRENILTLDLVGLTREEALSRNMRQKKMVERETNLSVVPREVNQNELTLSRGKL
ncbi:hypothetical protein AGDE_15112 [Angomonas deanei]|uniref:Adenosine/AMP deaminase, putative n=1 Tax=Angomonas deanei TaxID=59799 RepID=A0A7G2CJP8_9TRYP|nr:hypothetical protein AGDE_15112 [Angomonas deanei]CAD2219605.1 Adenosine/AMP deaminase, putative [Angomonas deanei]|eukprot:EPY19673.1 hypothetical protein AGDE_15112 [Angomonas deanei]